jgi:dTDP-4-amino-4,6-dideoxygalactose transaminase
VIDSRQFILGQEVAELERSISGPCCGTAHAIGCASGSDALLLARLALGIQRDDEVLTTPYTFFATAGAIHRAGARPVFVDVEPDTFNMDMRQAAETISHHAKLRAVIPVHRFGACADMDPLTLIAGERGLYIIEDAAQSIGAEYKGRKSGSIGHTSAASAFSPARI